MRARLVALLLTAIPVLAAGCSTPTGSVTTRPNGYHITCADTPADAGRLQHVINSSRPRAVIEISGTCLLTKGISLLPDRTYTGMAAPARCCGRLRR